MTMDDARRRGWDQLDVIFVTGDAYVDHPAFGVPLLGRWLESHGFRVGIIAQPDWKNPEAFRALGRPRLFFAVAAGAMDSMVAHYTPARKLRHDDAYTPGNLHGARPNRACIVYTSCIKQAWKDVPVVIGGIEASLRRLAHYDFWEDKVRRSLLLDAKADLLVYGMGERPLLELATRMARGDSFRDARGIRGTAFVAGDSCASGDEPIWLPSYEDVASSKEAFVEGFRLAEQEQNPLSARTIVQPHGDRYVVVCPPALPLTENELDALYSLPYTKMPHPSYGDAIPAWEQIRTSITTHRGCCGGCAFCAIAHHQGTRVQSRSEASILAEVELLTKQTWFRGSVSDIGGPTANMYGVRCGAPAAGSACRRSSCLAPSPCANLVIEDGMGARLLRKVRRVQGVDHCAVASGIRTDLLERQPEYLAELLAHHVGGFLKVAPEHLVDSVTALMRKPGRRSFEQFLSRFRAESEKLGKKQFIIPYLMSGHPGCTLDDMVELALLLRKYRMRVEQVQDFTPTPGTLSTCMYYTGINPLTGTRIHVARSDREKRLQKSLLLYHLPAEEKYVREALSVCGREDAAAQLLQRDAGHGVMAAGASSGRGGRKGTGRKKFPGKK